VRSAKKKIRRPKVPSPLTEQWSFEVEEGIFVGTADTDYRLQPRAMVFDDAKETLFVGSKTNQIMALSVRTETASVLVDGHDGAVWGLCTHPTEPLFATGGYDNAIKIWDASTRECLVTFEFEVLDGEVGHEISCAHWSNDGRALVFGTENTSKLLVFSWDTAQRRLCFQQTVSIDAKSANSPLEPVSYLRFSADSSLLAAAHMDSNLYIYGVSSSAGPSPRVVLTQWPIPLAHVAAPINAQFSEKGDMVKTFTRDYEVAHWRIDADRCKGTFCAKIPDPDEVQWADDPLIAGWDVEGLYQRNLGWDGTDLNDATLTSDAKLIASGDDYGHVRLHNYPSTDPKTCAVYAGHAEFVVGVEFLRDDSQLITAGGEDMAIFQWKLHKNYKL